MKRLVAAAVAVLAIAAVVLIARGAAHAPSSATTGAGSSPRAGQKTVDAQSSAQTPAGLSATTASPQSAAVAAAFNPLPPTADAIGAVKPIPANSNPQVASVAEALKTKTHPERLSTLVQPAPFDAAAYAANVQSYVDTVEPGRALQSAQPGKDVPVLMPVGRTRFTIEQDGQAILRVRTKPGSPATFTSFDLGKFGNGLVSQTVVADRNGVASVSFTAGPGTTDAVHILAASPVATEQVAFDVMVSPKKAAANGG